MSAAPESCNDLPRLLSALADGTLDQADEDRLVELLRTDAKARTKYYDHVMLEALLRREGRRAAAQSLAKSPANVPRDLAGARTEDYMESLLPIPAPRAPVRATVSRSHPWLLVLAASILLGLLFSVGEATGVTRIVPTMIRIVTGEGSLVIEVDDPSVSVTLDGQDVTITGAGIHELRLRPGKHKFVATKDGQPLSEEVVTIEHGGRRIVKISRQSVATAGAAESKESRLSLTPGTQIPSGSSGAADPLRSRRVLIILASEGFWYPDYLPVRDTLVRAGVQVVIAAPTPDAARPMPGNPGHAPVAPDLVLAGVNGAEYDALYFCGGTGVEEFIGSGLYAADAHRVIGEAITAKKYVTALAMGPLVLADAGVLSGVRATCYQFDGGVPIERLTSAGAFWVDEPAVVSGLIITGRDPGSTKEFSEALLQQLGVRPAAAKP